MSVRLETLPEGRRTTPIQEALARLHDDDPAVAADARRKLRDFGPAAVPSLCRLLEADRPSVRLAAEALGEYGDGTAAEPLIKALRAHLDDGFHMHLAHFLGMMFAVVGALIFAAHLAKLPPAVWAPLLLLLGLAAWLGGAKTSVDGQRQRFVEAAGEALTQLAARCPTRELRAAPDLIRGASTDLVHRHSPCDQIANRIELALKRAEIRPIGFEDMKPDGNSLVAAELEETLEECETRLHSQNERIKQGVIRTLAGLGPPAVPLLVKASHSREATLRASAAGALGVVGGPECVEPLCALLSDKDPTVRTAAADALGCIGDPKAIPALQAVFHSAAVNGAPGRQRRLLSATPFILGAGFLVVVSFVLSLGSPHFFVVQAVIQVFASGVMFAGIHRTAQDPVVRAASTALERIASRTSDPRLADLTEDLRLVAKNRLLQTQTRQVSAEAADRIEAILGGRRGLPIAASAPEPAAETLPLPATPGEPELETLPRAVSP